MIEVGTIAVLTLTKTAGAALGAVQLGGAVAGAHQVPTTASSTPTRGAMLKPRTEPTLGSPPEYLTSAIINRQSLPVSSSHVSNVGRLSQIWGDNRHSVGV